MVGERADTSDKRLVEINLQNYFTKEKGVKPVQVQLFAGEFLGLVRFAKKVEDYWLCFLNTSKLDFSKNIFLDEIDGLGVDKDSLTSNYAQRVTQIVNWMKKDFPETYGLSSDTLRPIERIFNKFANSHRQQLPLFKGVKVHSAGIYGFGVRMAWSDQDDTRKAIQAYLEYTRLSISKPASVDLCLLGSAHKGYGAESLEKWQRFASIHMPLSAEDEDKLVKDLKASFSTVSSWTEKDMVSNPD